MNIVVITNELFFEGEDKAINALFEAGLERLHLRKPHASANECEHLIQSISSKWYGRISLHDHFGLAKKYGIGGLHLNSRNPQPPYGFTGTGLHSHKETGSRTKRH